MRLAASVIAASVIAASLTALEAAAAPRSASAHGRPPAIGAVVEDPARPGRLVAQATWGLAVRDVAGAPWRWSCSASYGVDARSEDPALVVTPDALLLGTFDGLRRSDDGGCSWAAVEALGDVFVTDLHAAEGGWLLALTATTGAEDRIWESRDGGRSWALLAGTFGEVLVDQVRAAPSDPSRIYASGAIPDRGTGRRVPHLMRSDDGGAVFEAIAVPAEVGERSLQLWVVHPDDPDVLYAEMLHFDGEASPERILRSEDGGRAWETVLEAPFLGGIAVVDGAVWVGSRLGGLWRSGDGVAFELVDPDLAVTCLATVEGALWVCVDEGRSGYALGRWDGSAVTPILSLAAISEPIACPRCSDVGVICPAWEPDVVYDLGLDASLPPDFDPDASTGAPRDAGVPSECLPDAGDDVEPPGSCACRAGGAREGSAWPWGLLVALIGLLRRRVS